MDQKKQYYPSFLKEFRDKPYDAKALETAFYQARIGGTVRGENEFYEFCREFSVDESHWEYHQRILRDDVLFRLLAEGYIHPKVHPVGAFYHDQSFYGFVFPFIHTAVLKRMAVAIETGNLETVKLLEQWIEPFGTLFKDSFYSMIQFTANQLLKELDSLTLNRKVLPFDTYGRISPALMRMMNRLPERLQPFRDKFGLKVIEFAVYLRNEMKVYTQPSGLLTRLKLLNLSADVHAQRTIQEKQWESEKEAHSKEKFSLNHLIWIIPAVFIVFFIIWRQTDMGKSDEARMEERQEQLAIEEATLEEQQKKINLRMEAIDLNELVGQELFNNYSEHVWSGNPKDVSSSLHKDNGEMMFTDWLKIGRTPYFADQICLTVVNSSSCDAIVFVRQKYAPFMERAFYLRSGRELDILDDKVRACSIRIYPGTEWVDSLVTPDFDKVLEKEGVPEEAKDQFPVSKDLKGRFMFPAKSLWNNLQPVETTSSYAVYTPDGYPVFTLVGDHSNIEFRLPATVR